MRVCLRDFPAHMQHSWTTYSWRYTVEVLFRHCGYRRSLVPVCEIKCESTPRPLLWELSHRITIMGVKGGRFIACVCCGHCTEKVSTLYSRDCIVCESKNPCRMSPELTITTTIPRESIHQCQGERKASAAIQIVVQMQNLRLVRGSLQRCVRCCVLSCCHYQPCFFRLV